jgi:hypothetical protein
VAGYGLSHTYALRKTTTFDTVAYCLAL